MILVHAPDSVSGFGSSKKWNRNTSNVEVSKYRTFFIRESSNSMIDSVVEEVLFVLPKLPKVRPAVAGVERGAVAALDDAVALAVELLLEPDHVVLLVLFAQLVPDILQLLFSEVVRF